MASRLQQIDGHLSPLSVSSGPTEPPLLDLTIGQYLARTAKHHGLRKAVISHWQERSLSYEELHQASDEVACGLHKLGIQLGDRVAVCAGNRIEYTVIFFAAAKVGAILVVLNPSYPEKEQEYALKAVGVTLLFISMTCASRSFAAHIDNISSNLPSVKLVIIAKKHEIGSKGAMTYSDLQQLGRTNVTDLMSLQIDQHDVVNIQFTSGQVDRS